MKDFLYGLFYPIKSIDLLIKNKKILLYSIIPIIINLIIYTTLFIIIFQRFAKFTSNITGATSPESNWFNELLYIFLLITSLIIFLIITYIAYTILGNIITAPFNEKISQLIERIITKRISNENVNFWKDTFLSTWSEIKKILFYCTVMIFIMLLSIIPLIGTFLTLILGLIFTTFFNAFDYIDYPLARKYLRLREKIRIIFSNLQLTFGFGISITILLLLPLINSFLKPIFVVSGTSLYFEKYIKNNYN